jgi:predicted molibdopterin-dependent oxidoreductase YjgC
MSFAFPESTQTNRLTSDAYDFITETPEFKACAVRVEKIAVGSQASTVD